MKNNPISVMYFEHDIIKRAIEIVSECENLWEKDKSAYCKIVDQLLVFFKDYSDGFHHRKEEEILFPVIDEHPDFTLTEILDELKNHHENFRDYTIEISDEMVKQNYSKSYKLLKEYCSDLMDHIAAENEELFVLAQNLLSDDELETIYFKFKDIDLELGEGRKSELEHFPDKINSTIKVQ